MSSGVDVVVEGESDERRQSIEGVVHAERLARRHLGQILRVVELERQLFLQRDAVFCHELREKLVLHIRYR